MKLFLNIMLVILKAVLIPVIIVLYLVNLAVRLLLSLAKGLAVTVCVLILGTLGILMYFGVMDWNLAWQYFFYPMLTLVIIFAAYLFPAVIKSIIKELIAFMEFWVSDNPPDSGRK